jgi:hypothetical protein
MEGINKFIKRIANLIPGDCIIPRPMYEREVIIK